MTLRLGSIAPGKLLFLFKIVKVVWDMHIQHTCVFQPEVQRIRFALPA